MPTAAFHEVNADCDDVQCPAAKGDLEPGWIEIAFSVEETTTTSSDIQGAIENKLKRVSPRKIGGRFLDKIKRLKDSGFLYH
jgi:hypothetical protein